METIEKLRKWMRDNLTVKSLLAVAFFIGINALISGIITIVMFFSGVYADLTTWFVGFTSSIISMLGTAIAFSKGEEKHE
jgi:uncharacterized membrane protein HdeD (DUF308 family)